MMIFERFLAVLIFAGPAPVVFADALGATREDPLPDFPVLVPRTTHWLLLELARGGSAWWLGIFGGDKFSMLPALIHELTSSSCANC